MLMRDHHKMEEEEEGLAESTAQDYPVALEDRISKLPDSILHQILARPPLTIRDLILVSVLSKRWRGLWKSSPFIDLDDTCFIKDEDEDEGDKECFARFVDTVLLLRDRSDLERFHLLWFIDLHLHGQRHLYEWVQHAVSRNVKVIELHFKIYEKEVDLPRTMFNCSSLEELSVMFHMLFNPLPKIVLPQNMRLPMLRKLHIKHMEICEESMEKIVFGCYGLEELILEDCWLISVRLIFPELTDLTVERCCIGGDGFSVSCPDLRYFRFIGNFIDVRLVLLRDLSSIVSATILTDYEEKRKQGNKYSGKYCGCTMDFICRLANAEALKIISSRIEILPENVLSVLPHFPNLKNLTLGGWKMSDKFQLVSHFIKQSPSLEMLTLTSAKRSQENEGEASQKIVQLRFHCPNTVIACRIQGDYEENKRLVKLVTMVILSTYKLTNSKVRIAPRGRIQDPGGC